MRTHRRPDAVGPVDPHQRRCETRGLDCFAKWQMQIAWGLLDGVSESLADIASQIGHESVSAFGVVLTRLPCRPAPAVRKTSGVDVSAARDRWAVKDDCVRTENA